MEAAGGAFDGRGAVALLLERAPARRGAAAAATSDVSECVMERGGLAGMDPAAPSASCELCGHTTAYDRGCLGPLLGPVQTGAGPLAFVHRVCALWSPEVYQTEQGTLRFVKAAIKRGRTIRRVGALLYKTVLLGLLGSNQGQV